MIRNQNNIFLPFIKVSYPLLINNSTMSISYIYVIGSDNPPYKVGISRDPARRLKSLQTGHPFPLQLHYTKETDICKTKLLETVIHRHLKMHKTSGEWFDVVLKDLILDVEYVIMRYGDDPILKSLLKAHII